MNYTEEQIKNMVLLFKSYCEGRCCFYCGLTTRKRKPDQACRKNDLRGRRSENAFTRDHVIPKSHGGDLTVTCCHGCNSEKADLTLEEFRMIRHPEVEFYFEGVLKALNLV